MGKPKQLKLPFDSSSGASGSLPRGQAQVEDWHSSEGGSVTGWSAHEYLPQDLEMDSPEVLDYGPDLAQGQEEVGNHVDASGDVAVWSAQRHSPLEEEVVARDAEVLTETDMADIVRRAREFLEKQGPSLEEELCEVVGPQQASPAG